MPGNRPFSVKKNFSLSRNPNLYKVFGTEIVIWLLTAMVNTILLEFLPGVISSLLDVIIMLVLSFLNFVFLLGMASVSYKARIGELIDAGISWFREAGKMVIPYFLYFILCDLVIAGIALVGGLFFVWAASSLFYGVLTYYDVVQIVVAVMIFAGISIFAAACSGAVFFIRLVTLSKMYEAVSGVRTEFRGAFLRAGIVAALVLILMVLAGLGSTLMIAILPYWFQFPLAGFIIFGSAVLGIGIGLAMIWMEVTYVLQFERGKQEQEPLPVLPANVPLPGKAEN